MRARLSLLAAILLLAAPAGAQEAAPSREAITDAVRDSLRWAMQVSVKSTTQRDCYMCHHQGLPVMARALAATKGFPAETEWQRQMVEFSRPWFESKQESMRQGRGVPGNATTVGYMLMMESAAGTERTPLIDVMLQYLDVSQQEDGRWDGGNRRPPGEGSDFAGTGAAIEGLARYAPSDAARRAAIARGVAWLAQAAPADTEDLVFRLRGMAYGKADAALLQRARRELLAGQRQDGGWAQTPQLSSDAWATGTALVALHESGLPASDPAYQRGVAFLLADRQPDGTWHVVKRARGGQTYFDPGYPYEEDQFISFWAAGWATMALLYALPDQEATP